MVCVCGVLLLNVSQLTTRMMISVLLVAIALTAAVDAAAPTPNIPEIFYGRSVCVCVWGLCARVCARVCVHVRSTPAVHATRILSDLN